jgi:nucleoside-diphosphate-sugar epimerase
MILITGGLGFIGLHTARRFLDAREKVVLTHDRVRRGQCRGSGLLSISWTIFEMNVPGRTKVRT